MSKIKTMLKVEKYDSIKRYYPTKAENFRHIINSGLSGASQETKKNLSYSLRYLEFLKVQLDELVLDDLMKKMIWKNFIITSISIIEVIMFNKVSKGSFQLEKLVKQFVKENPLDIEAEIFNDLDRLRKLRNKVHLEIKFEDDNTDWFMFEEKDYKYVKLVLHQILTSKKMFNSQYHSYLEFLK